MCTVSWLHKENEFELFCNRDEARTRPAAREPEVMEVGGVRCIAPLDSAGGTWIAVNDQGLALCLLNGSGLASETCNKSVRSRGHIILRLLSAGGVAEACHLYRQMTLVDFAPFRLVLVERRAVVIRTWNGVSQSGVPVNAPVLTSSSVDEKGAHRSRLREFEACQRKYSAASRECHLAFHRSHGAEASAYSPCMHRADAQTVSFTTVQVSSSEVSMHYSPECPCRHRPPVIRRLSIAC